MTSFVLTPQVRELILRAKQSGGKLTPQQIADMKRNTGVTTTGLVCDPRAFYPQGHKCSRGYVPPTRPIPGKILPPWIRTTPPILPGPIDAGGVPIPVKIERSVPTRNGGAVTTVATPTETVTAVTDASGDVKQVEVKPNALIPLALAAAAFILLGG